MDFSTRLLVAITALIAGVGVIDALVTSEWDLLVLFAAVVVTQAIIWIRHGLRRPSVTLRRDLARWLEHRGEQTGEPFSDVLDRAIATYKHGLTPDDGAGD